MSDLRQVLGAMVIPFAEQLDSGRNERAYVRFVAHSTAIRRSGSSISQATAIGRPIGQPAPPLGRVSGEARQAEAWTAGRPLRPRPRRPRRTCGPAGRPVTPKRVQLFVNDLLNTAIGALTAPVSPATTVLLRLS